MSAPWNRQLAPGAQWNASLTCTPALASRSRAAFRSETIRYTSWVEPGAAEVRLRPNWTEHPEPGGVNWIRRKSPPVTSAASRQSRREENSFAGSASETGMAISLGVLSTVSPPASALWSSVVLIAASLDFGVRDDASLVAATAA